jgi:hypothetical protein
MWNVVGPVASREDMKNWGKTGRKHVGASTDLSDIVVKI